MKNPYEHDIEVIEAYTNVDYVKLLWPNDKKIDSSYNETIIRDYSQFMHL